MIRLGPGEQRCLDYLRGYFAEYGYPPAQREMAAALNLSHTRIGNIIASLVQKGWLRRAGKGHRRIELLEHGRSVILNPEILSLLRQYAGKEKIAVHTAANELLRGALGAV